LSLSGNVPDFAFFLELIQLTQGTFPRPQRPHQPKNRENVQIRSAASSPDEFIIQHFVVSSSLPVRPWPMWRMARWHAKKTVPNRAKPRHDGAGHAPKKPRQIEPRRRGLKWPKMAPHLTNFCDMAISHVLAPLPRLDASPLFPIPPAFAPPAHPRPLRPGENVRMIRLAVVTSPYNLIAMKLHGVQPIFCRRIDLESKCHHQHHGLARQTPGGKGSRNRMVRVILPTTPSTAPAKLLEHAPARSGDQFRADRCPMCVPNAVAVR
jgi:hypothetical protein